MRLATLRILRTFSVTLTPAGGWDDLHPKLSARFRRARQSRGSHMPDEVALVKAPLHGLGVGAEIIT
jgi:hypothetical protein